MKLAGVMGWPVCHSLSPQLHGWWLQHYGIQGAYIPLAVQPMHFSEVTRVLGKAGFRGANVTMPHKEAALSVMDEATPLAQRIGAVNTIVYTHNDQLIGSNTDSFGFIENLHNRIPDWHVSNADGPAVILGAGGVARAIVAALVDQGVKKLFVVNRSHHRAMILAAHIGGPIEVVDWSEREKVLEGATLLVNATILGMLGVQPLIIDLRALPKRAVVVDAVYVPYFTPLLAQASARGNPVVDGLGMLLHQARPGFAAWFGVDPEVTEELRSFMLKLYSV